MGNNKSSFALNDEIDPLPRRTSKNRKGFNIFHIKGYRKYNRKKSVSLNLQREKTEFTDNRNFISMFESQNDNNYTMIHDDSYLSPIKKDIDVDKEKINISSKNNHSEKNIVPVHQSQSNSLNSDDLMLNTDVNLDLDDDDINKDFISSEKDDPFLSNNTEGFSPRSTSSPIVQSQLYKNDRATKLMTQTINEHESDATNQDENDNGFGNNNNHNNHKNDHSLSESKSMGQTETFRSSPQSNSMKTRRRTFMTYSQSARRPHSLSSPPPSSINYKTPSSQIKRRTQFLSHGSRDFDSYEPSQESAHITTVNEDLSTLKLMILRLGKMLIENETSIELGSCTMFHCNNNNHKLVSEPTTPLSPGAAQKECLFERNWSELSKDELLSELKYVQKINENLQNKLKEKDRIIGLMKSFNYHSRFSVNRAESCCSKTINRSFTFDESSALQECLIND